MSPKEFYLGSRAAIDKTLSRLAQKGNCCASVAVPMSRPIRAGLVPVRRTTESVVQAIEASCVKRSWPTVRLKPIHWGLTTQVPTPAEVFSNFGVIPHLHLGSRCVELKHANRWQLLLSAPCRQGDSCAFMVGSEAAPAARSNCALGCPNPSGGRAWRTSRIAELDGKSGQRGNRT